MSVSAIIVAGGKGTRMGAPVRKQYLLLDQRPILSHTLQVFAASGLCDQIILVVPAGDVTYCETEILRKTDHPETTTVVPGGAERQDSVFSGLEAVKDRTGIVLIHDGVRPFVEKNLIRELITCASVHGACIPGIAASDTLKEVDEAGCVQRTVDRKRIYLAQTPQAFQYDVIRKAHDRARRNHFSGTDDASLVEQAGGNVMVIQGSRANIKITTQADLALASGIVSADWPPSK